MESPFLSAFAGLLAEEVCTNTFCAVMNTTVQLLSFNYHVCSFVYCYSVVHFFVFRWYCCCFPPLEHLSNLT